MDYKKRIRDLREDADLTQAQVAEILGTSQIEEKGVIYGKNNVNFIPIMQFHLYNNNFHCF